MKRLLNVFLAAVLAFAAVPTAAIAESLTGGDGWKVTYTADGKMKDTFDAGTYFDEVSNLQPGDDITFTVAISHENSSDADWYLNNEVVKTLEAGAASGSAYGYELTYTDPSGATRTLYSSESVGGDNSAGLTEATNALDDYIALGTLKKGQSGSVSVKVTLDGETEGNDYFDTLARLVLKFAVEPQPEPEHKTKTVTERRVVQTGDETRLFPLYVAMTVSGLLLAGLAAYGAVERRKEKKEGLR